MLQFESRVRVVNAKKVDKEKRKFSHLILHKCFSIANFAEF